MKLTRLEEDLRIHQRLDDEPNDVGGLTAQALKEKFDQAGVTIQGYLNETHLPEEEKALEEAVGRAKAYTDRRMEEVGDGDMAEAVYDRKGRRADVYDYADTAAVAAKTYAREQAGEVRNHANVLTEGAKTQARSYTDIKAAEGKRYTDTKAAEAKAEAQGYADTKLTEAKSYTDEKVAEVKAQTPASSAGGHIFLGNCELTIRNETMDAITFEGKPVMDPKGMWSEENKAFTMPEGAQWLVLTAYMRWGRSIGAECHIYVWVNDELTADVMGPINGTGTFIEETKPFFVPVKGGDRVVIGLESGVSQSGQSQVYLMALRAEVLV